MNIKEPTFEQIRSDKSGTVYKSEIKNGLHLLVLRGPMSLCAYIGFPTNHPLANMDYDQMGGLLHFDVHGGLTYSGNGVRGAPKGWYWYGWDYAHSGDYWFFYTDNASINYSINRK